MLLISEFARAGNVTIRALRFYDELGLLSPAHVVPENGYRRYSPAQFAQLNQIQAFKDMGFSLQEIADLVSNLDRSLGLFKSMLGRVYTVRGFDKYGNVELEPKRLNTVCAEPEFLKLRARKSNNRRLK